VSSILKLDQLRSALQVKDPKLVEFIIHCSYQSEPRQETDRRGADSFEQFIADINSAPFKLKSSESKKLLRVERIKTLESDDAEISLSHCLNLHQILFQLYEQNTAFGRWCLLQVIPRINLVYGPWRALKAIFKQAELTRDTEIFGALAARFDQALASDEYNVSRNTLIYLVHRAWRYLRRVGETLPVLYSDLASDILVHYDDKTKWSNTWIFNHIFYHESGSYNRQRFTFNSRPSTLLKYRAFPDSWRFSSRPVLSLLERAQSEQVRRYACTALKTDFRATLRDIKPEWITRLINTQSETSDEFVIWLLSNSPQFEQSEFRELDLHDSVLQLFHSPSDNARIYATTYARIHARDLKVSTLVKLIDNSHESVRSLGIDLLSARDPRKDVGLEIWADVLNTEHGFDLANKVLQKHFNKRELTPEWFATLFLNPSTNSLTFAISQLLKIHAKKTLGTAYFSDLILRIYDKEEAYVSIKFICEQLATFNLNELDKTFLQIMLVNQRSQCHIINWIDEGLLMPEKLDVEFLKLVVFHPDWITSTWLRALKQTHSWAQELQHNEELASHVLRWLYDIRYFSPEQLSFDWLMKLAERREILYHNFAVEVMNKSFLPADFSPKAAQNVEQEVSANVEINIDLGGDTFMFTGKLAKMTRSEAQNKVTTAGGCNASGVTKKLKWLVIGDEGSSLYGEGRKGSKQLKAEKLIEDGVDLQIISETAFLQMLSGEQREFGDDAITAGCEKLWSLIGTDGADDAPLTLFALSYIRLHHKGICLNQTDRPVDPGAQIPDEFLSFERVEPLFHDKRSAVRDFALELAHWEFARWKAPIASVVTLSESPQLEVREFITKALTADDDIIHRNYRIDPEVLTTDTVYSFCESVNQSARDLGMLLIDRNPRLQVPQALFALTESPDRAIRSFVIRRFWHWYHDKGISSQWQPQVNVEKPSPKSGAKAQLQYEQAQQKVSGGVVTKPEELPATFDNLQQFLRRVLFEIAPGRLPPSDENTVKKRLKSLPTRQSKLSLIETIRDLAVEDIEFARYVLPLLYEFKGSRGMSEHAACLVAVTRIKATHTELEMDNAGVSA